MTGDGVGGMGGFSAELFAPAVDFYVAGARNAPRVKEKTLVNELHAHETAWNNVQLELGEHLNSEERALHLEKLTNQLMERVERAVQLSDDIEGKKYVNVRDFLGSERANVAEMLIRQCRMQQDMARQAQAIPVAMGQIVLPLMEYGKASTGAALRMLADLPFMEGYPELASLAQDTGAFIYTATYLTELAMTMGTGAFLIVRGIMLQHRKQVLVELQQEQQRLKDADEVNPFLNDLIVQFEIELKIDKAAMKGEAKEHLVRLGLLGLASVRSLNEILGFLGETGGSVAGYVFMGLVVVNSGVKVGRAGLELRDMHRIQTDFKENRRAIRYEHLVQLQEKRRARVAKTYARGEKLWVSARAAILNGAAPEEVELRAAGIGVSLRLEIINALKVQGVESLGSSEHMISRLMDAWIQKQEPEWLDATFKRAFLENQKKLESYDRLVAENLPSEELLFQRAVDGLKSHGIEMPARLHSSELSFDQLCYEVQTPSMQEALFAQLQAANPGRSEEDCIEQYTALIAELFPNTQARIHHMKALLRNRGVEVHDINMGFSRKDALEVLREPKFRQEAARQFSAAREGRRVEAKNAIQTLVRLKHRICKASAIKGLLKAVGVFSVVLVGLGVGITLNVLAITGIWVPGAIVLLIPGLIFFGLGMTVLFAGTFAYYRSNPNTFRSMLKGHSLKLHFRQIGQHFDAIRLRRQEMRALKSQFRLQQVRELKDELRAMQLFLAQGDAVSEHKVQTELLEAIKTKFGDMEGAAEKVRVLAVQVEKEWLDVQAKNERQELSLARARDRFDKQRERVRKWKLKIDQAGMKDFMLQAKLGHIDPESVVAEIVDGLLVDEYLLDDDTREVLKEQMGIDLDAIRESGNSREAVMDGVRQFFAMESIQVVGLHRRQKKEERYRNKIEGEEA